MCRPPRCVSSIAVARARARAHTHSRLFISRLAAPQAVADIVRTTLGPKSMLKCVGLIGFTSRRRGPGSRHPPPPPLAPRDRMLLDPMGGIIITNDGNAILREIDVAHPAAKSMLELARSQDEEVRAAPPPPTRAAAAAARARRAHARLRPPRAHPPRLSRPTPPRPTPPRQVGDGTTSVIILAGEMLVVAEPFLTRNMHPTVIVRAYARALDAALEIAERLSTRVDLSDASQMRALIRSCIATKFSARYGDLVCDLALAAVHTVTVDDGAGHKEIDIKRFAKVREGGGRERCGERGRGRGWGAGGGGGVWGGA